MRKSKARRWYIPPLAIFLIVGLLVGAVAARRHYRHMRLTAVSAISRRAYLSELVRHEPSAANFRLLALTNVELQDYGAAKEAFENSAKAYEGKGMVSQGYAMRRLSQRYEVQAVPFVHLPAKPQNAKETLARFEPINGCYVGAFIDHEDSIRGTYRDEYGEWRRDASAFNHLTGVHHAIFFMYLGYGRQFPAKFVRHMNDNGAAAQIAWEPETLEKVQDDAYLHGFAKAAKASHTPIFLRFASEMNGDWVPYNGNPQRYIEKFRLVAKVMHEEAPNVAMVWCPFETPVSTLASYYPGPEAVDWVGINVYSVPFWDNDVKRPGDWRNPSDALRFVYGLYAKRHPIMVCEYGASHRSSLDNVERVELARTKMGQFYAALPRQYPRVKAVCWLSMNAIKHAMPGRQTNDYSILDSEGVRQRYQELLDDPYFLRAVSRGKPAAARQQTVPLQNGQTLKGRVAISAWVKLYDDHPRVVWRIDGVERESLATPGPYRWALETSSLPKGTHKVELLVYDQTGRQVGDVNRNVIVGG